MHHTKLSRVEPFVEIAIIAACLVGIGLILVSRPTRPHFVRGVVISRNLTVARDEGGVPRAKVDVVLALEGGQVADYQNDDGQAGPMQVSADEIAGYLRVNHPYYFQVTDGNIFLPGTIVSVFATEGALPRYPGWSDSLFKIDLGVQQLGWVLVCRREGPDRPPRGE